MRSRQTTRRWEHEPYRRALLQDSAGQVGLLLILQGTMGWRTVDKNLRRKPRD